MICQTCQDATAVISVMVATNEGLSNLESCRHCASESGFWCPTHQEQHVIYADKSSACLSCIREKIAEMKPTNFSSMINHALTPDRRDSFLSIVPHHPGSDDFERAVAKLIVTAEQRLGIKRAAVVLQVVNEGHEHLVPPPIMYVPAA